MLLTAICLLGVHLTEGCSLNSPHNFGDKCQNISFIWSANGTIALDDQNPDYDIYFNNHICPDDAPFCMTLLADRVGDIIYPETHYCSDVREHCPKNSHLYARNCERDTVHHCGANQIDCLDREKGIADAECIDGDNGKVCIAKSCLQTFAYLEGECVSGDQCCGTYCNDCYRSDPRQVCLTVDDMTQCGAGCPESAPDICNGVCIDTMTNIVFCGAQNCEIRYCVDDIEGWRNGSCDAGECLVKDCLFGYHLAKNKDGQNYCEPDTPEACGEKLTDCHKAIDNSVSVDCVYGHCIASECQPGYWAYDDACLPSANIKCGSQICGPYQRCNEETQVCECEQGYTDCQGNCYNLTSNTFHCGGCSNKCHTAHAEDMCTESVCTFSCIKGYRYYPETDTCEPDNTDHCGKEGKVCAVENATNICSDAGECLYTCDFGYTDNGKTCCADIGNGYILVDSSDTCHFECNDGYFVRGNFCSKPYNCDQADYIYYTLEDDTEVRAYCLRTANDISQMASAINSGQHYPDDNTSDAYMLANDITSSTGGWVPIGSETYPFTGKMCRVFIMSVDLQALHTITRHKQSVQHSKDVILWEMFTPHSLWTGAHLVVLSEQWRTMMFRI